MSRGSRITELSYSYFIHIKNVKRDALRKALIPAISSYDSQNNARLKNGKSGQI